MRTEADEWQGYFVNSQKIVVIFDSGVSSASEMIDLLCCSGARVYALAYADNEQTKQIVNIIQKHKKLPS